MDYNLDSLFHTWKYTVYVSHVWMFDLLDEDFFNLIYENVCPPQEESSTFQNIVVNDMSVLRQYRKSSCLLATNCITHIITSKHFSSVVPNPVVWCSLSTKHRNTQRVMLLWNLSHVSYLVLCLNVVFAPPQIWLNLVSSILIKLTYLYFEIQSLPDSTPTLHKEAATEQKSCTTSHRITIAHFKILSHHTRPDQKVSNYYFFLNKKALGAKNGACVTLDFCIWAWQKKYLLLN
jgi:hypothetical protein